MILLHLTCSSPAELFTSNRFQSPSFVCLQRQVSIASSRFLSMSLKLESELAKIDEIHDLRKIKDKRRARDRVIKMYEKTITDWTKQSIEQLNGIEIEKKIGEVTFSSELYRALQFKFEDISSLDEHFNIEEERERAEPILAKGETLLSTLRQLLTTKQLHLKGQELLFNLSVLQDLDQLNTATGRAETVEFKTKVIEFQRDTATYSEKPSFSTYRSDLMKGVKRLMQRLNEEQLMHEKSTPTPSSIVSSSSSDYTVNKLKIKLPRFDGNPLHWNSF